MTEQNSIAQIVNDPFSRFGKIFMIFIQSLIILSLITFSLETLPNLSTLTRQILDLIEVAVVVIFSIEYLLRIA